MTNGGTKKAPPSTTETARDASERYRTFPRFSLEETLVVPKAIQEKNAGKPMNRLLLAEAIQRKPSSSQYEGLLSASLRYGLTTGSKNVNQIALTERGNRATRPTSPGEGAAALREAALAPELMGRVYRHYDNSGLPSGPFFRNTLEREFGVPRTFTEELERLVFANGRFTGILRDVSGSPFIILENGGAPTIPGSPLVPGEQTGDNSAPTGPVPPGDSAPTATVPPLAGPDAPVTAVFLAHGKNRGLLEQVKQVVTFGQLTPVVADEREATAIPVPEKVIGAMHSCQAGIIIVSADTKVPDGNGGEKFHINENVLIEIGAATVLYRKKVILLWDKRIDVPSNLQGLYRCEFEGDTLDWDTGVKLQNTLTEFRSSKQTVSN